MSIKNVKINTELSFDKLYELCKRVDSLDKSRVAEEWVLLNDVISESERCKCYAMVCYRTSLVYSRLSKTIESNPDIPDMNKLFKERFFDGVRELKVG